MCYMLVGVSLGSYELLLGVALLSSKGTSNDYVDKKRSQGWWIVGGPKMPTLLLSTIGL